MKHPSHAVSRRVVWFFVMAALRTILFFGAKVRVLRPPTGFPNGGLILASNHISHFDPPLVAVHCPRPVDWLAMTELFSKPWSKRFFDGVNAIPIHRGAPDRAALREAVARLRAGRMIGIFPEGGIRDGTSSMLNGAPPLRGTALLSRMSGAPILPCAIVGSDRLYNKKRWRFWCRAPVWIAFGEAFPAPESDAAFETAMSAAMTHLAARVRAAGASEEDFPKSPQTRMRED